MLKHFLTIIAITLIGITNVLAQAVDSINAPRTEQPAHRPKVAVVLAGGGAKGVAHVPVLRAIEEAGIPIDLVVGTSIGSIVGGLYCTGYSPDTLHSIITSTDWIKLITNNPDFNNQTLSGKKANENYVLRFALDMKRWNSEHALSGVLEGANVIRFFRDLTRFLPDSLDFEDMPIPFACVGTNAITGECKVFTSGNLPTAMRASMAIPTAFTPVTIDSTVYVDGGICDNFPVDVARKMGADIIIGVDLVRQLSDEALANSAIELLLNSVDLYGKKLYQENIQDADIYIPIDVTGYTAASFAAASLDTLFTRGEHSAKLFRPRLDSLSKALNLSEPPIRIRVGQYSFAEAHHNESSWILRNNEAQQTRRSLLKANDGSLKSSINLGGRFDNLEYATLLIKANLVISERLASLLSIQTRLGERLEGQVDFSQRTIGSQRMALRYTFLKNNLDLYDHGEKVISSGLRTNKFVFYLSQEWKRIRYSFGLSYNMYHYRDVMSRNVLPLAGAIELNDERYFSYFIKSEVNTLDRQYFPTRGHRLVLNADLVTDNLLNYQDKTAMPIFSANWECAISPTSRLTLRPHASARIVVSEDLDEPMALKNIMGGLFDNQYLPHQTTMAGVSQLELVNEDGLAIVGLSAQYSNYKDHYIVLRGDVCSHTNNILNALDSDAINWGIEGSYNIRTAVGPITLKGYWSNLDKTFNVTMSAGYCF